MPTSSTGRIAGSDAGEVDGTIDVVGFPGTTVDRSGGAIEWQVQGRGHRIDSTACEIRGGGLYFNRKFSSMNPFRRQQDPEKPCTRPLI